MKKLKTLLTGGAAAMLAASPVIAQADADRAASPSADSEQFFAGNGLVSLLIIGAVIAGLIVIGGTNDDDVPVSP